MTVPLQTPAFFDVTLNMKLFTGVTVTTAPAPLPHVAASRVRTNAWPGKPQPGCAAENCCVDGIVVKNSVAWL